MSSHVERVRYDIVPCDDGLAMSGRGETCQHAHGRRLARAVRSEESYDFALEHLKRDIDHGRIRAVIFRHVVEFDHFESCIGFRLPALCCIRLNWCWQFTSIAPNN